MALADAVPFAVAHWSLDEASGTRFDDVGSSDLTDINTVGSASGKFGTAADFESSSSEYLSVADNAALSGANVKILFRAWIKLESKSDSGFILSKFGDNGALSGPKNREYALGYHVGVDRFYVEFGSAVADGGTFIVADVLGSPSTGVWYLIHAWHDSDADEIGISVNAGTANTTAHSGGVFNGSNAFLIGAVDNSGVHSFFDGLIDDVVFLKGYVLDATERTADYNGGTGVAFEDWAGGGITAEAPAATLTLSGLAPTATKSTTAAIATLTLTGLAPTARHTTTVSPATLTLTGLAPTVSKVATVSPAILTFTGLQPSTPGITAAAPVATLTLAGLAPGSSKATTASIATLTLTGLTPVTAKAASIAYATLTFTGLAPGSAKVATIGVATLLFVGLTPSSGVEVSGPFFAVAWASYQPGDVAGTSYQPGEVAFDSYQPGDKAGTNV